MREVVELRTLGECLPIGYAYIGGGGKPFRVEDAMGSLMAEVKKGLAPGDKVYAEGSSVPLVGPPAPETPIHLSVDVAASPLGSLTSGFILQDGKVVARIVNIGVSE